MKCYAEKPASKGGGKCGCTEHLARDCPYNTRHGGSSSTHWGDDYGYSAPHTHDVYTDNPGDMWMTEEICRIDNASDSDWAPEWTGYAYTRNSPTPQRTRATKRAAGTATQKRRPRP